MRTESRTATPIDAAMAAARNGDVRAARARAVMFSGHAKLALAVDNTALVTRAAAMERSSAWLDAERLSTRLREA